MSGNPMNKVQQVKTKLFGDQREDKYYIYILRGGPESYFYNDGALYYDDQKELISK